MPGSYNNASQAPYGSPGVQASVPGSVVSTASVASPTGAVVSTPEDMVSFCTMILTGWTEIEGCPLIVDCQVEGKT